MAATAERPRAKRRTRHQVADELLEILGNEPISAAEAERQMDPDRRQQRGNRASDVVLQALDVLEARGIAKQIPSGPGQPGGWVHVDSHHEAEIAEPLEIEFDYEFQKRVPLDQMFVDQSYQRPLTTFADRIEKDFDPYLFQALMLSDRGPKAKPRYAIIDGQTRWTAARRVGVQVAPAQIFTNLTPEDEASIFWRIQKNRAGMVSYYRFRAQLRSKDPTSMAIRDIVEEAGYTLGSGAGELRAVGALEKAYAQDPFTLERTLQDWRSALPDVIPEGTHIGAMMFFFRHFPITGRNKKLRQTPGEIDDERLVRRLSVAGVSGLQRKMNAAKEMGRGGSNTRFMAEAIEAAYLSGGRG